MLPRATDIMVKNSNRFYIYGYRRLLKINEILAYLITLLLAGFVVQTFIEPTEFRYYVTSIDGRVFPIPPVPPPKAVMPAAQPETTLPPASAAPVAEPSATEPAPESALEPAQTPAAQ
jgi:hypothetical protein